MSAFTSPEREKFRLSMLLNDKRYRSYTFQFFALFVLICIISYLGKNLVENLAKAGLNISYGFLADTAGYDINQRLIEYSSTVKPPSCRYCRSIKHFAGRLLGLHNCNSFGSDSGYFEAFKQLDCCKIDGNLRRNLP